MIVSNGNNDHYSFNKKSINRNLNLSYQTKMQLIKTRPKKMRNIKINNYPLIQIINQTNDSKISNLENIILQNCMLYNSNNNIQMPSTQNTKASQILANKNSSVIDLELCNHRIEVEKKFNNSMVNKNFVFPKRFNHIDYKDENHYENDIAVDICRNN